MQAHDIIVHSAIERHGGYVFATGCDGFCTAFSSAVDAVTALSASLGRPLEFPPGSIPAVTADGCQLIEP